jgi:hypothetical protein
MSAASTWNSAYSFTEGSFNVRPAGQILVGSVINQRDFADGNDALFLSGKRGRATQRPGSRIQGVVDSTQFTILPDLELLFGKSEAPAMKTAATRNGTTVTPESGIGDKNADTLGSQINISIFLGLIILTVFVMPSIGLGDEHERWYGDVVFSILIGAGTAIAWRRRGLFVFSAVIGFLTLLVRWLALWMPTRSWELRSEVATS